MLGDDNESAPLLSNGGPSSSRARGRRNHENIGLVALFGAGFFLFVWVITFNGFHTDWPSSRAALPKDPLERAKALLDRHPLIDGHIDLPVLVRARYSNKVEDVHLESPDFPRHVNIPKLREGKLGGFFWSAYVPCADSIHENEGANYTQATWRVRDTLEQIDVSKQLINQYPETFALVTTSGGIREAFASGRIASLIGLEGGHQLGNSLAVLRMYYELGVRYVTLTHTCNNAFAGSCGVPGRPTAQYGLTGLGEAVVREMNRLGMIIDVSHTSAQTARDVLRHSAAPPIFSHSNAGAVWDVPRNVPDDVLELLGSGTERSKSGDGIVMATFAPQFVSESEGRRGERATLARVADHIEFLGNKAGRSHVGIGSDFDGILSTPVGLEDVSRYPYLFAELIRRGWSDEELVGLAGGNFLRVFAKVEKVAADMRDVKPDNSLYSKRADMPLRW